ncbi:hypothetical protein GWN91_02785, partial [Candidatus Saccharibacteria bacterium]|nr:hypothetical protein [Candidatus Saccharibacteria bacterium]NIV71811.1 hypothetical protein [Calditrichia bacterium]NIW78781.1 hypothetical protein [Calditrichia bacterium]
MQRIENVANSRPVPFAPTSRDSIAFMSSDLFTPVADSARYKVKIGIRGIGVKLPALNNPPNWELFRVVLANPTSLTQKKGTNVPRNSENLNPLKQFTWRDLVKEITSQNFYIQKEFIFDLNEWVGNSVYLHAKLLNNLGVKPVYVEEIRLNDAANQLS